MIYKVLTCIIWRIYINHFDCPKIIFTKNFQHIKVIPLNIEIFSMPKINRFIYYGTKRIISFTVSKSRGMTFARPCELIAFLCSVEQVFRQLFSEFVEVNGKFGLTIFI